MAVSQPSPHPARGSIHFSVFSPTACEGEITLHAVTGRLQSVLWKGNLNPGMTEFNFNANVHALASGTYFIKVKTPLHAEVRKVTVIR
jgi:hypothetical protein